jgi:hypothetical protein
VHLLGLEAGAIGLDEEAVDLVLEPRPHDRDLRDVAVRDPALHAVEHVAAVALARGGAHAGGIRAEVGLGQAEAADRGAAREPRQPALLLLVLSRTRESGA